MEMLCELLDFNPDLLAMNLPFKAFKKEERKACAFDVEEIMNFSSNIPSAFPKLEPCSPPICRVPPGVPPYSQPFSFPPPSRLTHLDPYFYRKFYVSVFILHNSL